MKCRDFELVLCDYVDDQLDAESRRELDSHRLECPACEEAVADAEFGLALLHQAEPVELPPELIGDIIHSTVGVGTGRLVSAGGGENLPSWLQPFVQPFLQPRFVMSMAMTVMSFSLLTFYGDRAVTLYQDGETQSMGSVADFGQPITAFWDQATDVYESALTFYGMQVEGAIDGETTGEAAQ
jgi:hypothetical protein